jgi:hypothetical protein
VFTPPTTPIPYNYFLLPTPNSLVLFEIVDFFFGFVGFSGQTPKRGLYLNHDQQTATHNQEEIMSDTKQITLLQLLDRVEKLVGGRG